MTCLSLQDTAKILGATTPRCEVARVFRQRLAAEKYAKEHVGAFAPRSKTKRLCEVLKVLGGVYEMCERPFVPADLADCIARHVADCDLFREEPGAELLSIMLKYGPVRATFSAELRKIPFQVAEIQRSQRLWRALRNTVIEMAKPKQQSALSLWSQHWGRNVQHHSGWLAFLQRAQPNGSVGFGNYRIEVSL